MKFDQKKDGSFDIVFTEEEINILSKNKKLTFSKESSKHLINNLSYILFKLNQNLDEETKNLLTFDDIVKPNKPKD